MTITVSHTDEIEQERQRRLAEAAEGQGEDWAAGFEPGSFGCHELLDRATLLADAIEAQLLNHPSCLSRPEWFARAELAASALRDLYQEVGAAHLGQDEKPRPDRLAADQHGAEHG